MTQEAARVTFGDQPRLSGNDWTSLVPHPIGHWQPQRSVTVVIPAHQARATLPLTLASLSVQTYPSALLEVLVVDDGSQPPVQLPELRPERTRIVRTATSWGRAHACRMGALEAAGEVLHWLDADMVVHRDEVEAQMRWHHLIDHAVVLGTKIFVDVADGLPDPEQVVSRVAEDRLPELFADRWTSGHDWVEEHLVRTHDLRLNPTKSYLVHTGACASVGRELYLESNGMDDLLKLGEDVELGYRLAQRGAVFVPDAEALSWHLGRSTLMQQQEAVNRYNRPFVTDRIPDMRRWRTRGRSYTVPWVEIVVDATGHPYDEVRHSVNGALTGSASDVAVSVLGPWPQLSDLRRSPLRDPDQDLRLTHAEFAGEHRVRFLESAAASAFPATFRLLLPTGWAPGHDSLRNLAAEMARKDRGLVSLLLPDGRVGRLERTSAFHRAARLAEDPAELDTVVDEVSGSWWYDATEEGFTHAHDPKEPRPGPRRTRPLQGPGSAPPRPPHLLRSTRRIAAGARRRVARRLRPER